MHPAMLMLALFLQAEVATPPKVRSFPRVDYPAEAVRARSQGTVRYAVDLSRNGRVEACRVTESSGHVVLDEVTCAIMRKAKFSPALDAGGNAVATIFSGKLDWRLDDEPVPTG